MKWVSNGGYGHAVIETNDDGYVVACGRTISLEAEGVETGSLQERPYAIDTCQTCHGRVKSYALGAAPVPEGLFAVPAANSPKARLTAEQRKARIHGEAAPVPANGGDAAPEAPRAAAAKESTVLEPGSDEDLGFDPVETPGALKTSGGAIVVVPETKPKRASRRKAQASVEEDFSDIDN